MPGSYRERINTDALTMAAAASAMPAKSMPSRSRCTATSMSIRLQLPPLGALIFTAD